MRVCHFYKPAGIGYVQKAKMWNTGMGIYSLEFFALGWGPNMQIKLMLMTGHRKGPTYMSVVPLYELRLRWAATKQKAGSVDS